MSSAIVCDRCDVVMEESAESFYPISKDITTVIRLFGEYIGNRLDYCEDCAIAIDGIMRGGTLNGDGRIK